jgi:NACalpha-BTF3-like transcription factor
MFLRSDCSGYCDKEPRIGLPSTWFPGGDGTKLDADEKTQLRERLQDLLSVANRFGFDEIKRLAVKALENDSLAKLEPVDKIILARQFEVSDWLRPAYMKLCQRSKPLSTTEAGKLGAETAALVAQVREMYRDSQAYAETKNAHNFVASEISSPARARMELDREADIAVGIIFFPETEPDDPVDPKDIELVIEYTGCSRAKAVKDLRESGGDVINASESLIHHIYLQH